jgi:hypothetical protein
MLNGKIVLKVFSLAALIEAVMLVVTFATTGHAGPGGRYGAIGLICVLVTVPGSVVARVTSRDLVLLAGTIFVVPDALLGSTMLVVVKFKRRWFRASR